jgi:hypothetical protein
MHHRRKKVNIPAIDHCRSQGSGIRPGWFGYVLLGHCVIDF